MQSINKLLIVAIAAVAFGSLLLLGGQSAQASHGDNTLAIEKECEDTAGAPVTEAGEFDLLVDFTFDFDDGTATIDGLTEAQANTAFDIPVTLGCTDTELLVWSGFIENDEEAMTEDLDAVINFVTASFFDGIEPELDDAEFSIVELGAGAALFEGDCDVVFVDGNDFMDIWDDFTDDGLDCLVTNIVDPDDVEDPTDDGVDDGDDDNNTNVNLNTNVNANENTNVNTQTQTNSQSQTQTNEQTTTVEANPDQSQTLDSNPSQTQSTGNITIDLDGGGHGHDDKDKDDHHHQDTHSRSDVKKITAPNTGSAGLAAPQDSSGISPVGALGIGALLLAVAGFAARPLLSRIGEER